MNGIINYENSKFAYLFELKLFCLLPRVETRSIIKGAIKAKVVNVFIIFCLINERKILRLDFKTAL